MILPEVIREVVEKQSDIKTPQDTVLEELRAWAEHLEAKNEDLAMMLAIYMLGFNGYNGFY